MKALNHKEITNNYMIFLGYFSAFLIATILCAFFYHQTYKSYLFEVQKKKTELDHQKKENQILTQKIDSLNMLLKLLNTYQVQNEVALERSIIKLKNSSIKQISKLEEDGNSNYKLEKNIVFNIETALENKRNFQQVKAEEEFSRKKLLECIEANKKVKDGFAN